MASTYNKGEQFRCARNEGFVCKRCAAQVAPLVNGSSRNHCPHCLWSKHVDVVPGDRRADCCGMMEPVAIEHDARRRWMIVHRCTWCGAIRRNKAALNDPAQPDRFAKLLQVARRSAERSRHGRGGTVADSHWM